jgi:hypothetical protein
MSTKKLEISCNRILHKNRLYLVDTSNRMVVYEYEVISIASPSGNIEPKESRLQQIHPPLFPLL